MYPERGAGIGKVDAPIAIQLFSIGRIWFGAADLADSLARQLFNFHQGQFAFFSFLPFLQRLNLFYPKIDLVIHYIASYKHVYNDYFNEEGSRFFFLVNRINEIKSTVIFFPVKGK